MRDVVASMSVKILAPATVLIERCTRYGSRRGTMNVATMVLVLAQLLFVTGCGGGGSSQNSGTSAQGLATPPAPSQINSYFGTDGDIWSSKVNHTANQISGEDITLNGVLLAGVVTGTFDDVSGFLDSSLTNVPPQLTAQTSGFALDIPGRAALVRYGDHSYPLIPLAPTDACTSIGGTVTYQYVTIPSANWAFTTDTAYGTFQVSISGSAWDFANITQFTLAGTAPSTPGTVLPAGFCGITTVGYTVTASSGATNPPVATVTMGFGPSGFFLEDNGSAQGQPQGVVRSNALGAGVGAIGTVQPSSPLDTGNVVGGKYLGFYYEPGITGGAPVTQLASFGCSGSNCPAPPTPTSMVGGVFLNDDLTQSAGTGITIDLGTQDAANNGLYASATVGVSGVSFPAIAVVGSLENKYAIFVIAQDAINSVPLAVYLFQQ